MNDGFSRYDEPLEPLNRCGQGRPEEKIRVTSYLVFFALLIATLFSTYLAGGFFFSIGLVFILGVHEFGHYWASRKHNVSASLPYFIPAPPLFLAGTFGAFIKIKDPIPDRQVLMEIGAFGPIAGFIVAVPILMCGLSLSQVSDLPQLRGISFGSSIILQVLTKVILGVSPLDTNANIELHPLAFAGWIGLFVTALNLLPIGQLDGGHIFYSLFRRHYDVVAKLFFIFLLFLGYFWTGWLFWAFLITLFGFKHPPLVDETRLLEIKHRILGYVSIFIFVVTFIPVPFELI